MQIESELPWHKTRMITNSCRKTARTHVTCKDGDDPGLGVHALCNRASLCKQSIAAMMMCARLPESLNRILEWKNLPKPFPEYLYHAMREDGPDLRCTQEALWRAVTGQDYPRETCVHHCADGSWNQGAWLSFSADEGCLVKFRG